MIYSPAHRLVFLKTRKTAGTSVEIELSRHVGDDAVLTPLHPPEDEAKRRAAAGRGAQHHDRRKRIGECRFRELGGALRRGFWPRQKVFWNHMPAVEVKALLPEWDSLTKIAVVRNPWDVYASRVAFETARGGDDDPVTDNWPIYTIDDEVVADIVVRYEHLADELPAAFRKVGIEIADLPRAKSSGGRPPYRETLTDAEADLVARVCAKEIKAFGYEF